MDRKLAISLTILLIVAAVLLCGFQHGLQIIVGQSPLAATGTLTLVQHPFNSGCASATTCSITLTSSITANNIGVVCLQTNNAAYITGTDNSGTFILIPSASAMDITGSFGELTCGWIPVLSAETSHIVVNISASEASQAWYWEYSFTGTPQVDGGNGYEQQTVTAPVSPSFTYSGGGVDTGLFVLRSSATASAVSGCCTLQGGTFYHAAFLTTPATSWTTPTWTMSSGTALMSEVEIGFGVTPFVNQTLIDWTGTNGNAVTVATIQSALHGYSGMPIKLNGTTADLTFSTSAVNQLQSYINRFDDGTSYTPGSATTGLSYSSAASGTATTVQLGYVNGNLPCAVTGGTIWSCSDGTWWQYTFAASDSSQLDTFVIDGVGGTDFVNLHAFSSSPRLVEVECGATNSATTYATSSSTWYWVTQQYNYMASAFTLTQVQANTPISGQATYLGTITGGGSNAYAGMYFDTAGFTNGGNNVGGQQIISSSASQFVVTSATAVNETHAGTATVDHLMAIYNNANPPVQQSLMTCVSKPGNLPSAWFIGSNATNAQTAGKNIYFSGSKFSLDGTFPLLP